MNAPMLQVGIIVHSLNHNNIGRVYPFLRAFETHDRIKIHLIGWDHTGTLFPLLNQLNIPITRLEGPQTGPEAFQKLLQACRTCSIIHCFKNQPHLQTAERVAKQLDIPLILDLDDWELGLYLSGVEQWPRWRQIAQGWQIAQRIKKLAQLEQLARTKPSAIVANSRALQAYYGGEIIYTAAEQSTFECTEDEANAFRNKYEIPENVAILGFLGTPHKHKGIDELIETFQQLNQKYPQLGLLFVGVPKHNTYYEQIKQLPNTYSIEYLEASEYGAAYRACNIIMIPQRAVTTGIMQTPAKLILAMAAGRPIITTDVGDISYILGDAGLIVEPENIEQLTQACQTFLEDSEKATQQGKQAQQRFQKTFTLEILQKRMLELYEQMRDA